MRASTTATVDSHAARVQQSLSKYSYTVIAHKVSYPVTVIVRARLQAYRRSGKVSVGALHKD
jgi:hypothetical protein